MALAKSSMSCASRIVPIVVAFVTACDHDQQSTKASFHAARFAIIDGTLDGTTSAAALIRHRDESFVCSGAAIAPDLVVTARHCVFSSGSLERPLAADGFRVGFGADEEHLQERSVSAVEWIGEGDAGSLADASSRGEDVALLHLQDPVPADVRPLNVKLEYGPSASDDLKIVGFGVSSLSTGSLGVRLQASVTPSGFDAASGVLQVSGPSACFGDSGGPLLLEPQEDFVGVLGDVGGSDAGFCDIGLSFAATVANVNVRNFLEDACRAAGGCGPRIVDAGPDVDAAGVSDAQRVSDAAADAAQALLDGGSSHADASHDGAARAPDAMPSRREQTSAERAPRSASRGGSCSIAPRASGDVGFAGWALVAFMLCVRRGYRKRGQLGPISLLLVVALTACSGAGKTRGVRAKDDASTDINRDSGAIADAIAAESRAETGTDGGLDAATTDGQGTSADATDASRSSDSAPEAAPDAAPVSLYCGDGIRDPVLEQCDDGPGDELDPCTPDCRARDAYVTDPLADVDGGPIFGVARQLGSGAHVVAASRDGFAIVYQEADLAARVFVQSFDAVGHRKGEPLLVSEGRTPAGTANAVIAVVSGAVYAVAWTDGTDGTPDIAMRTVDMDSRVLGPVRIANETLSGPQQDPDILRVNGEWIVAWTDLFTVHARRFDGNLSPVDAEEMIPQGTGLQSGVALAENAGTWALGWRANDAGLDSIQVVAGANSWSTEYRAPGPSGDRPALATLPDGSMVVVFSAAREQYDAGQSLGDELRGALLDAATTGAVYSQALSSDIESTRPRAARIGDRVAIVWQSEDSVTSTALPLLGEIRGPWNGASAFSLQTVSSLAVAASSADRTNAVIAPAPYGAFVGAWEDWTLAPGRPLPDVAYVFEGFQATSSATQQL